MRTGGNIEAMGSGDVAFQSLADRYLQPSPLSTVSGDYPSILAFVVHAATQAKSVPSVGGLTRIVVMEWTGGTYWENQWKIQAFQGFWADLERVIRDHAFRRFSLVEKDQTPAKLLDSFCGGLSKAFVDLRARLDEIEHDPRLNPAAGTAEGNTGDE